MLSAGQSGFLIRLVKWAFGRRAREPSLMSDQSHVPLDIKPFGPEEYKGINGYSPPANNAPPMYSVALAGSGWGDDAIYIHLVLHKIGIGAQVLVPTSGDYPILSWNGTYEGGLAVMKQITQPVNVSKLKHLGFVETGRQIATPSPLEEHRGILTRLVNWVRGKDYPGPDLFDRTRRKLDIKPFGPFEYQNIGFVRPENGKAPMFSVALAGSGWGDDAIYIFLAVDKEGISAQVLVPKSGDYPVLNWYGSYDGGLAVMKQIRQPVEVSQLRSLEFVDAG